MKEPTSVRTVVKSWANKINTCRARFVVSEITAELALFLFGVILKATWSRAEERVQSFNFYKRVDNRS
ncbi:hypothetical protein SAMN05428987_6199 [Paenibacillus sp. CF095]|nr:hypothetical protein SAMN05428987_6199 [Paenibacillus sp. CF095]